MSLDNTSQPSVKYCADVVNAKYIHGRPGPELVPSRLTAGVSGSNRFEVNGADAALSFIKEQGLSDRAHR